MTDFLAFIVAGIVYLFLVGAFIAWLAPLVWAGYTLSWAQTVGALVIVRLALPTTTTRGSGQ